MGEMCRKCSLILILFFCVSLSTSSNDTGPTSANYSLVPSSVNNTLISLSDNVPLSSISVNSSDSSTEEVETKGFFTGFLSSLEITLLSELGDNSFFTSVVLAMRHSRILVYMGAMSAMFFMTIITGKNMEIFFLNLSIMKVL